MSRIQFKFKYDEYGATREVIVYGSGTAVSSVSYVNKGTAFNEAERLRLGLQGSLPPGYRNLDEQVENTRRIVDEKVDDIERFIFIRALFDRNVTLAHALIQSDLERYMGIVYTPTIGLAVKKFSELYRQANGLHFYPGNIDMAEDILRRYLHRDIRVAVVTDNQGIPGMGDQGAGGIAVCLGKLMLYTQGGGIAPWHCLPISLDVGTDNEELLGDKRYLGWRNKRLKGEEYLSFVGRFVRAFRNVFPDTICQWENLSLSNGFGIRDAFADEIITFNDDIQGTGAVALAAVLSAMRAKLDTLTAQKFLVFGNDCGSVGICEQLEIALQEEGLSEREARDRIFLAKSDGIITLRRAGEYYSKRYAKDPKRFPWLKGRGASIAEAIAGSGATVYISTSGTDGCVEKGLVKALLGNTERPVIIPLYSPAEVTEQCAGRIYDWTGGQALVVSGSPLNSFEFQGNTCYVSQGNNALIFPGVGLGVLASGAREILPEFFTAAARAVADHVSREDLDKGKLLPAVGDLEQVSNKVAQAVAMCAVRRGVSRPCVFSTFQHQNEESRMWKLLTRMRWTPQYLPIVAM
ncbi:MAG: oxaloacetate-decarboxylating malate dehydrogenase [Desulfopila sp.]